MKKIIIISVTICLCYIFYLLFIKADDHSDKLIFNNKLIFHEDESLNINRCPLQFTFNIDERQMYNYELNTDVTINNQALSKNNSSKQGIKTNINATIKGILNFRIFEMPEIWKINDNNIAVGFQLSPVKIFSNDKDGKQDKRMFDLEQLYQTFFAAIFTTEGKPFSFYFPNNLSIENRSSLSEIIYGIQLYIPDRESLKGRLQWLTTEKHLNGSFKTEYIADKEDCATIYKETVRAISLPFIENWEHGKDYSGYIIESEFQGTISKTGSWIRSLFGSEIFEIKTRDLTGQNLSTNDQSSNHELLTWYRARTHISLKLIEKFDPDANIAIWTDDKSVDQILKEFVLKQGNDSESLWGYKQIKDIGNVENATLIQTIEEIKQSSFDESRSEKMLEMVRKLQIYLEKFPDDIALIPSYIKNFNITGLASDNIVFALEQIGNSEAQSALEEIMTDQNQSSDIRLKSIIAAGGIALPEKSLSENLFNIYEAANNDNSYDSKTRGEAALLSLGFLSNSLRNVSQTSESNEIIDRIINHLNSTEDQRTRLLCLKSLGNSGAPSIYKELKKFFNSSSSSERNEAYTALLNIEMDLLIDDTNAVEDLNSFNQFYANNSNELTETDTNNSQNESEPDISNNSKTKKEEKISTTLIKMLNDENNENVRKNIILNLVRIDSEEVYNYLQKIIDYETNQDTKEIIEQYLNQ